MENIYIAFSGAYAMLVTLEEISSVKLMDRNDTKFVLSVSLLPAIFQQITEYYDVQKIEGIRIASYETTYYDTPAFNSYHEHLAGKLNRVKIRIRNYLDSDLHFLEVKSKTNTGKIKKTG